MPFKIPGLSDEQSESIYNNLSTTAANNKKRMMPRGAFPYPMVGRAVNEVEKRQPDLRGVNIKVDPWEDKYSGSNRLASTPVRFGNDANEIDLNPALTAFPQGLTESSIAHELQHIRQNKQIDPADVNGISKYAKEFLMPYEKRPSEMDAFDAQEKYRKSRGLPEIWSGDQSTLDGFPSGRFAKMGRFQNF